MSVNKILRTINGGCREYSEPIPDQASMKNSGNGGGGGSGGGGEAGNDEGPICTPTKEFWIPCKVMPSAENLATMAAGGEVVADTVVKHVLQKSSTWGSPMISRKGGYVDFASPSGKVFASEGGSTSVPSSAKVTSSHLSTSASFSVSGSERFSGKGIATIEETSAKSTAEKSVHSSPGAEPKVLRVLIIEDTVPVQKLLSRWMQKARCKVTCASNGSIGLNQLMTGCFDIVFIDFLMVSVLPFTNTTRTTRTYCNSIFIYKLSALFCFPSP